VAFPGTNDTLTGAHDPGACCVATGWASGTAASSGSEERNLDRRKCFRSLKYLTGDFRLHR